MSKNILMLAGVGLIAFAIILSSFYTAPVVAQDDTSTADFDEDPETGPAGNETTFSAFAVFTDASGNPVSQMPFEFTQSGNQVSGLDVTVSWIVTGEAMNWDTFAVNGDIKLKQSHYITRYNPEVGEYQELISLAIQTETVSLGAGGRAADGSGSVMKSLDFSHIDTADIWKDGLYLLGVHVDLKFTCQDDYGDVKEEFYRPMDKSFSLAWYQPTGSMTVVATMGTAYVSGDVIGFDAVGGGLNPIDNPAFATLLVGFMIVATNLYTSGRRKR